jgi:hypothetical protein
MTAPSTKKSGRASAGTLGKRSDVKVQRVAERGAGDRDRRRRGRQRGNGNPAVESLDQFLEDERGAGERRVEGRRETRARAGGQ